MQADYTVVLAATRQNRQALEYASEELRHSEFLEGVLAQACPMAESWLFAACQALKAELASVKAELDQQN